MTMEDYNEIYDLWINTPGMGLNDIDDSRDGIKKFLSRNPDTCFIAKKDSKTLGVIMSGHDGRRGFIYHTAVAIPERKKGIGTKLVNRALDALKSEGINKVALVVFGKNESGNTFWEQLGFQVREDLNYRNKALIELKPIIPKG